jgi:hypothetical protein
MHCTGGAGGSFPVHLAGLVQGLHVWYTGCKGLKLGTSAAVIDVKERMCIYCAFQKGFASIGCVLCVDNTV